MSSVQTTSLPQVGAPKTRGDLRAAAGLLPVKALARVGGSCDGTGEHVLVAKISGTVIGVCRVSPEVMRVGESRLKVGLIRCMAVHPAFDCRSVTDALIEESVKILRERRYHLALTTGEEFEMRRRGFVRIFECGSIRLEPGATAGRQPLKVRRAKQGDVAAISRLYGIAFEGVAGSLVRSRAHIARIWHEYTGSQVVTNSAGKVLAYFVPRLHDSTLEIIEFGFNGELDASDFRAATESFADQSDCSLARISGSNAQLSSIVDARDAGSSGPAGYARVIDTDELLQCMVPEWETGPRTSHSSGAERELTLVVGPNYYRIRSRHGAITVDGECGKNKLALTSTDLICALLGAVDPMMLLERELRLLTPDGSGFYRELFPLRAPYISPLDLL